MTGDNPFDILGLPPTARSIEIERRKQKLLGMLELGLADARTYEGRGGPAERTAELVRDAADRLSRPSQRLAWELWTRRPDNSSYLDRALELHVAIERTLANAIAISVGELDQLGCAWDLAFESEDVRDRAVERALELELEPDDAEAALETFRKEVEDSLIDAIGRAGKLDFDNVESELLAHAAGRHTDQALERLEQACERYCQGPAREVEWVALAEQFWSAVEKRGEHVRSTAFYTIYGPLQGHAIELHEQGREEDAARQFAWLSKRARAIGDTDTAERDRKNAQICLENHYGDREAQASYANTNVRSRGGGWLTARAVLFVAVAALSAGRACGRSHSSSSFEPPPYFERHDLDDRFRQSNELLRQRVERDLQDMEMRDRSNGLSTPAPSLPEYEAPEQALPARP